MALSPVIPYIVLVVSFVALIKGADFFVEGASSLAKKLGVSSVIIGLTVVAMGTSAPEAAVSISAGLQGSNEIALGNVIGSNLFNLLVVLGFCMLITKIPSSEETIKRDFPWNIIATVAIIAAIVLFDTKITRLEGIALLVLFVTYMSYLVYKTIKDRKPADEEIAEISLTKSLLFLIGGLAFVIVGGDLVVDSATVIAKSWGVSDALIGLTIIAMGTSLPELVTSIVAAKKNECDMAIGNVIGSNLFNLLFVLGMSATISPIAIDLTSGILIDAVVLLAVTVMMYIFSITGNKLQKLEGVAALLCYGGYLAYIITRAFS
ncbi:MAG: calcium/sodium antiporter [Clostridia bacterium]|nr:calcium/sodium antiporter [Clostridia bacterium]